MKKAITFFSEKGGTGKTTLSVLFASWLRYSLGQDVTVIDCDYPSYQFHSMRDSDNERAAASRDVRAVIKRSSGGVSPYEVSKLVGRDTFTQSQLDKLYGILAGIKESGDGYMIIDLPGRLLPSDPSCHFMRRGLVDFMVIPVNADVQTVRSAGNICGMLRSEGFFADGAAPFPVVGLWNGIDRRELTGKTDWLSEGRTMFERAGVPVCCGIVQRYMSVSHDALTPKFVRSTLCWPQENINKFCPGIAAVFVEIKARIDGIWNDSIRYGLYGTEQK